MRANATTTTLIIFTLALAPALGAAGCDDNSTSSQDAIADGGQDVEADTAPDTATDTAPDTAPDTATDTAPDTDTDTGGDFLDNPWGLPITAPETYTVPCQDPLNPDAKTKDLAAMHWLCTFDDGTSTGHVYIEATPTGCSPAGLSTPPEFGLAEGWMSLDGAAAVAALPSAAYDWGGNHHNDSLQFAWDGKSYRYYHSSLGVGWRKCQPMDCMQIRDQQGTLLEDGCTKDRTLPIVCRQIQPDGTWEALTDTFTPCEGDPNYQ